VKKLFLVFLSFFLYSFSIFIVFEIVIFDPKVYFINFPVPEFKRKRKRHKKNIKRDIKSSNDNTLTIKMINLNEVLFD